MNDFVNDGLTDIGHEEDSPTVRLFYEVLMYGYQAGASDIHLEPMETNLQIRVRIDGILRVYRCLEKSVYLPLMTCAKIRSGMDIAEKRLPQDGHCRVKIAETELNLRTSTMPTIFGENMVLRFLNRNMIVDRPDTFGMDAVHYRKMLAMLKRPSGMIYFTGPTGSGKTTTLYMILERLAQEPLNIMTIEDPVEKVIPGISQSQVNRQSGFSFETGLRAILRQDPDILMVGETRDSETAKLSIRAASTGNLVFSTLHTKSAAGAISRLHDLGVEPYMVAECLNGVVSQRLAKKVCNGCRGKGCFLCNGTGYRGRIAVHEILIIDSHIRKMIVEQKSTEEIFLYAKESQNMISLKEQVLRLVEEGITSIEECYRLVDFE